MSAAATLRQLAIAMPGERVHLMDRCIKGLTDQNSPEALAGLSVALAGLIAGVCLGELGIPSSKAKSVSCDYMHVAVMQTCTVFK